MHGVNAVNHQREQTVAKLGASDTGTCCSTSIMSTLTTLAVYMVQYKIKFLFFKSRGNQSSSRRTSHATSFHTFFFKLKSKLIFVCFPN